MYSQLLPERILLFFYLQSFTRAISDKPFVQVLVDFCGVIVV